MRSISDRISAMTGGRPGPRRALPSYCCAINRRCQASKVSGVTIVAMSRKTRRPSDLGLRRQTTALIVREPQTSGTELFPKGAVLLLEIVDHLALLLVHPTGECDEHEPQRRRQLDHGTQATRGDGHRLSGARPKPSPPLPNRPVLETDRVLGQYGVRSRRSVARDRSAVAHDSGWRY